MLVASFEVIFFTANATEAMMSGAHRHTALLVGTRAQGTYYSWGEPDNDIATTRPTSRTDPTPVALADGVFLHAKLGYSHRVVYGTTGAQVTLVQIADAGKAWATGHQKGGAYPNNCRGAVDDFLERFVYPQTAHLLISQLRELYDKAR